MENRVVYVMATNDGIQTGVETNNTRLKTTDWDVEAYADDGEHAMCWLLRRVEGTIIESQAVACEAGLRDNYGPIEAFDVDADTTTIEFAQEHADADPEAALKQAREHFRD
jgi:hypothetical protein